MHPSNSNEQHKLTLDKILASCNSMTHTAKADKIQASTDSVASQSNVIPHIITPDEVDAKIKEQFRK